MKYADTRIGKWEESIESVVSLGELIEFLPDIIVAGIKHKSGNTAKPESETSTNYGITGILKREYPKGLIKRFVCAPLEYSIARKWEEDTPEFFAFTENEKINFNSRPWLSRATAVKIDKKAYSEFINYCRYMEEQGGA